MTIVDAETFATQKTVIGRTLKLTFRSQLIHFI